MSKPNPTGRVDILLSSLLTKQVADTGNPFLKAMHEQLQPDLDRLIKARFGPQSEVTKRMRKLLKRMSGPPVGTIRRARMPKARRTQTA